MSHYTPLYDSICTSGRLADLPDDTCRLFYVWLLAKCDSWGRLDARPRKLNAEVWPLLRKSDEETARALEALRAAGLVEVYWPAGHDPFLQVPDWEDKAGSVGRRSHRRPSRHPDPEDVAECKLPGNPGTNGREGAPPGGGGHCRAEPGSATSGVGDGARAQRGSGGSTLVVDNSAPTTSECPAPRRSARRQQPKPSEEVASRPEYAELLADPVAAEAWRTWLEHCSEGGAKAKPPAGKRAAAILNRAKREGAARFAEAVEYAVGGNYLQPTYRDRPGGAAPKPATPEARRRDDLKRLRGELERVESGLRRVARGERVEGCDPRTGEMRVETEDGLKRAAEALRAQIQEREGDE